MKTKSENSYQNLATFHLVRKTASSFLHNPNGFVTIVLGWVTARILFPSITGHVLGPFIVLPGFLVAIFCLILLLLPSQPWTRLLLLICSGMISDSIVYWCLRAGMGAPIALASLYSKPAIIGSVVTLLLVLSLYALFRAISFDFLSYSHRKVIINKLLVTALPILTIIILRVTFLITKEIPNEERSIIVHGVEIHHAVTGTILMLLMNIAATRMRQPPGIMFNALLGIIAGLVLDQVMYLPLIEVTDSAYNGIMSWIGAIAGVILFACAGIAFRHSRSYRPDGL